MKPASTYIDSEVGSDLKPSSHLKLLFKALILHGPGNQEETQYLVGSSNCGRYDVLWQKTDWADAVITLSWLPTGRLTGTKLQKALLSSFWSAEKEANEWDGPNFDELIDDKKSAFTSIEIEDVAKEIWTDK
jgi:hypothetical protein